MSCVIHELFLTFSNAILPSKEKNPLDLRIANFAICLFAGAGFLLMNPLLAATAVTCAFGALVVYRRYNHSDLYHQKISQINYKEILDQLATEHNPGVFDKARNAKKSVVIANHHVDKNTYVIYFFREDYSHTHTVNLLIRQDGSLKVDDQSEYEIIYPSNSPLMNVISETKYRKSGTYDIDEKHYRLLTIDEIYNPARDPK